MSNTLYRVGTANQYDNTLRNLSQRQSSLASLQENLTSGKRVVRASDDPVAAAQAERSLTRISRIQTEQRALDLRRDTMAQAEASLGEAVGVAQEMRQLMVSAGNAANSVADRRTIANQIQGLRDQFYSITSRKDTNGQPLFSALGSDLSPLLGPQSTAPDYAFKGLPGQVAPSETNISLSLDGDAAFTFQYQRDGVYHANVSNPASPTDPKTLNGRKLNTTPVEVADLSKITGDSYQVKFTVVPASGATPATATYQVHKITDPTTNPVTTTPFSAAGIPVPSYSPDKPLSFEVSGDTVLPGLKFTVNSTPAVAVDGTITYSPADGDTITLTPSTSVVSVLDTAVKEITASADSNQAAQAIGQAIANLDKGLDRIHTLRGYAGEMLNRADRITGDQSQRSIQLEAARSRAEDIDMVQGISDFQGQQTGYEAALKSYSMVQKLSLFNFIA
ncbi:MAG: flagellar hook-associated protein FlgL [Burkholderiaceae bacterium]|nr:flagellar hook-associated protein FlgL [Burkholderiaceae bacterium]